jgi:L-iditol 2-dehydrogenase
VESTHKVLILGGGPIGVMIAKVCSDLVGVNKEQIYVVEPFGSRREFLIEMGLQVFSDIENVPKSQANLFDRVFTATSNPDSHLGILDFVERGGRVNFFGGVPKNAGPLFVHANTLHYSEIAREGSHGSCPRHHKVAADLISRDELFWNSLITSRTTLAELHSAIARMRQGLELKVAVEF